VESKGNCISERAYLRRGRRAERAVDYAGRVAGGVTSVQPIFQAICAKTDKVSHAANGSAKTARTFCENVHNGIEYGDMQMICETYQMMKEAMNLSNADMHKFY